LNILIKTLNSKKYRYLESRAKIIVTISEMTMSIYFRSIFLALLAIFMLIF